VDGGTFGIVGGVDVAMSGGKNSVSLSLRSMVESELKFRSGCWTVNRCGEFVALATWTLEVEDFPGVKITVDACNCESIKPKTR
jgi:hypothetical protein